MRNLAHLIRYRRLLESIGEIGDDYNGAFVIPSPIDKRALRIIASCGFGWDHVSVSLISRCPTWSEMSYIKKLFFKDDETAMQLHVPVSDHISYHPYCLHLWRPYDVEIPRPPGYMVGPVKRKETT